MISLAGATIVASGEDPAAVRARGQALAAAGAIVKTCSPKVDLWSTLAEGAYDALVLDVRSALELGIYAELRSSTRTKSLPCLLLVDPGLSLPVAIAAALSPLSVLDRGSDDGALLQTLTGIVAAQRQVEEAESVVRWLQQMEQAETTRAVAAEQSLANLSHDLRTVLGSVYGFACNLRDEIPGPLTEAQRSHVLGMIAATSSAVALMDAARRASVRSPPRDRPPSMSARPSASPAGRPERAQRSLVRLWSVADEVFALFAHVAAARHVRFVRCYDESVCVWGDALRLKQVILNLVSNALKYTPRSGEITIAIRWHKPSSAEGVDARRVARVIVSDTGPGIPEAWRAKVFERGVRLEGQSREGGQGIGLAVVREIIVQHGGAVRVGAAETGGAAFEVILPVDRRERSTRGLLVLREGPAAEALLRHILRSDSREWQTGTPETSGVELLELARECELAVMIPSSKCIDLRLWVAQSAGASDEGTDCV